MSEFHRALDAGDVVAPSDGECTKLCGSTFMCARAAICCTGTSREGSDDSHTSVVGLGESPVGRRRSNDPTPIISFHSMLSALIERACCPEPYEK